MALSCKAGSYVKVLGTLLDRNLSKRGIFLLFGRPYDVLVAVRAKNLLDLDRFVSRKQTEIPGIQGSDYDNRVFAVLERVTQNQTAG